MESEIDEYPFFQGGILMTNKNSQFLLMDAFSHKVYTSNDSDFKYDYNKLIDLLVLENCGLSIPARKLLKIMGKNDLGIFLKMREEHF